MTSPPKFFACYALRSLSYRYLDQCYIGFTVNPSRRVRQHNGEIKNGAKKTQRKRPWDMVVVVYGFPSKVSALKFEWAWQNPHKSRKVKAAVHGVRGVGPRYKIFAKIHTLFEMVNIPPWNKYPIHIRFLSEQNRGYKTPLCKDPPSHMKVEVGGLKDLHLDFGIPDSDSDSDAVPSSQALDTDDRSGVDDGDRGDGDDDDEERDDSVIDLCSDDSLASSCSHSSSHSASSTSSGSSSVAAGVKRCSLCHMNRYSYPAVTNDSLAPRQAGAPMWYSCDSCQSTYHIQCLATSFLEVRVPDPHGEAGATVSKLDLLIVPDTGTCPSCRVQTTWAHVVSSMRRHASKAHAKRKKASKHSSRNSKRRAPAKSAKASTIDTTTQTTTTRTGARGMAAPKSPPRGVHSITVVSSSDDEEGSVDTLPLMDRIKRRFAT